MAAEAERPTSSLGALQEQRDHIDKSRQHVTAVISEKGTNLLKTRISTVVLAPTFEEKIDILIQVGERRKKAVETLIDKKWDEELGRKVSVLDSRIEKLSSLTGRVDELAAQGYL